MIHIVASMSSWRYAMANGELYTGFVAASADKIFQKAHQRLKKDTSTGFALEIRYAPLRVFGWKL